VLLLGEAGVGKTVLLEKFAPKGLYFGFRQVSSQTPLYAIAEVLRGLLSNLEARVQFDQLPTIWQQETARLIPELASTQKAEPQEQILFLEGLAQALLCLNTENQPLIFDDLHWADTASLEFMVHLVRRSKLENQPISIIATARLEELSNNTTLVLQQLEQDSLCKIIKIEALSKPEVQEFVLALSGSDAPLFSNKLYAATTGNPFFMLETIRFLFEQGQLETWDNLEAVSLTLPPSVRDAVLKRINQAGSAARRLLETAALTEDGFTLETIQPATALNEWEGVEGLEQAVSAHLLKRLDTGFGFQHDLIRQALQNALSPERQRLIHSKLAVSLEQQEANPASIAMHLEQAGRAIAAVPWRIQAAEQAERVYAHAQALEQYRMAVKSANRQDLFTLYQNQVRALTALGLSRERSVALEEMNQLALEFQNPQWQALAQLHLAQYLNQVRQYRQAISTIDTLLEQRNLSSQNLAWAWLERGIGWFRLGELSTGKYDLSNALMYEALLEPSTHAEIHSCLRAIALYEGEIAIAEHHLAREMEIAVRFGSISGKLGATTGAARIAMIKGDVLHATRTLQESLDLAVQIGMVGKQLYAQMWLSYNQIRLGHWAEAEINIERAIALAVQSEDNLCHVRLLLIRVRLQTIQGQLGAALDDAYHALKLAKTVSAAVEIIALRRLAMLLLDLGDTRQAQCHFQLALRHAQQAQSKAYYCSLETGLLHCAIADQDHNASQRHLANALKFESLAEHNEQTDLRFVQTKYLLWLGKTHEARALLEPLRHSAFPEDQWRFWKHELQQQVISGQTAHGLQLVRSSPTNPTTIELRCVLCKILETTSDKEHKDFQRDTKKVLLEMAASLGNYPDLKASFLELHADLMKSL
jgi:hypothetical protein